MPKQTSDEKTTTLNSQIDHLAARVAALEKILNVLVFRKLPDMSIDEINSLHKNIKNIPLDASAPYPIEESPHASHEALLKHLEIIVSDRQLNGL